MKIMEYSISDIATIKNGSTPSTKEPSFYDGNIIWITPKDLSEQKSRYIYRGKRNITEAGLNNCSSSLLPKGTLLLSSRAPIGLLSIAGTVLCTNQGFKNIVPNTDKVDSVFLYYYFITRISHIQNLGSGTTFKEVSKASLEIFKVQIPEKLFDQQRIATVLSSLDDKIELNNRINAELEAMAKTLYDYWFVQFDFPNEEGKPYKSSGGEMVWNEELKREIPDGWKVDMLGNHIVIERGISYKSTDLKDEGTPMINLNSFYLDGNYKVDGVKYLSRAVNENKELKAGDLIIATTDVTRNAYIIGKSFIIPDLFNGQVVASCDVAKLVVSNHLDNYYLNMLFNSDEYHRYIKGFATGTLVLHLNTKGIEWFKTTIPPKYLLNKFKVIKSNIEHKKTLLIKENQVISELRDWLLPMLMNGQVKVE
jgi:type I restriction enzyme S subunit